MEYIPCTAPKPELHPDSSEVEFILRQAVRWVLGFQAVVDVLSAAPDSQARAVASGIIPRAQLRTLESADCGYNIPLSPPVGRRKLSPNTADNDTGIASRRVKVHQLHPTIGPGVESIPRQTVRVILLVKAQVKSIRRALNLGSPSRRVKYIPRVRHQGCRMVTVLKIRICL